MDYFFHPEPPGELEGIHFGNAFNWNSVYEWLKRDDADLRVLIVHGPSGVGKEVTTTRLAMLTDREVRRVGLDLVCHRSGRRRMWHGRVTWRCCGTWRRWRWRVI